MSASASARTRPAGLMLPALFLAIAAFQVAATMIFPALPAIGKGLGASSSELSLSQSVFFAIGGLAAASLPLSDRIGRRTMLLGVIGLGALGSIIILATHDLLLFDIGRWMQAPGVIALPLAFLILREHVPADRYPLYLGWLSALNLGATGVDGAVAGWLTDTVGYQGIFWVALVIGLLALGGVLGAIRVTRGSSPVGPTGRACSRSVPVWCASRSGSPRAGRGAGRRREPWFCSVPASRSSACSW